MSEVDRLKTLARGVNVPFDPATTEGRIALALKGATAGDALDALCCVTATLIRTVPPDAREHAFVHAQHLIRDLILADGDGDA